MTIQGASIPGAEPPGQDRWTATDRGVIVLDGASAFDPDTPDADEYVDLLLEALADQLDEPTELRTLLATAITRVASRLHLSPGGPSSTVLLMRNAEEWLDLLVLGDSTTLVGLRTGRVERWTDQRLAAIATDLRNQYRNDLRAGHGYGTGHAEHLHAIQRVERSARNTAGGYWIAEADPEAAHHAMIQRYHRDDVEWCVLATDGAQRLVDHLGDDWATLAKASTPELRDYLTDLQRWEAETDPDGARLPRAKRHDDKTIAVWTNDR